MKAAVALDPLIEADGMIPEMPENAASNDKRERYFFYAGDEPGMPAPGGMSVQTPCMWNAQIRRGQVTPLRTVPVTRRLPEIPEGQLIYGTADDATGLGKMDLNSGPEAQELLDQYGREGDAAHQWGLVELAPTMLRGRKMAEIAKLRITQMFFPEWPVMPELNIQMEEMIERNRQLIENDQHPLFAFKRGDYQSEQAKELYLACADDMLRGVRHAQQHQEDVVATTNLAVTLPSSEPGYKRDFDERDKLFSKRTGIPLAKNSLRGNGQTDLTQQLIDKIQPQAPSSMDASTIAAIVAATVAALKDQPQAAAPVAVAEVAAPTKPSIPTLTTSKR